MKSCITCLFALVAVQFASAAPATAPSVSEIQADYDAQHYTDVVKKSAAALGTKPSSPSAADRVKLNSIKAESHLRLKQYTPAGDAFAAAAKDSTDEKESATLKATSLLMHKLTAGQYVPRQTAFRATPGTTPPKPEPINVLEPESRRQALMALFTDESKALSTKIDEMKAQAGLPELMKVVTQAQDVRAVELAATGSDNTTKQSLAGLGGRAADLMGGALDAMTQSVDEISRSASRNRGVSQTLAPDGTRQSVAQKRGLGPGEPEKLNDIVNQCQQMLDVIDDLAKSTGASLEAAHSSRRGRGGGPTLASIHEQATKLQQKAKDVLGADYADAPVGSRRGRQSPAAQARELSLDGTIHESTRIDTNAEAFNRAS